MVLCPVNLSLLSYKPNAGEAQITNNLYHLLFGQAFIAEGEFLTLQQHQ